MSGDVLICDTECYPNFWSIGFLRHTDKKLRVFEHSVRKPLTEHERATIAAIMRQNTIVGYNFINYDNPMIAVALDGADNARLKESNDRIIVGGMKYWHAEAVLGVTVPRWNVIDLMEPQPNAFASLKTLAGRMHAPFMQDLPYSPDTALTEKEMDKVLSYMGNDLQNTMLLYDDLKEPLALREAMGAEYGITLISKSDAQCGEAILKKCVEDVRGERVFKVETPAGTTFKYPVPSYLSFERPDLVEMLDRLRDTSFMVQGNGKVELPDWLAHTKITIGSSTYQMGIGGLHSTEANRAIYSDEDHQLVDADVISYYPRIIINSGLYPKALGPAFIPVYTKLTDSRVVAKHLAADKAQPEDVRSKAKGKADGVKIFVNGGGFGKLGSPYSVLFAPQLLIAVTLTGQLALLMLIERAERMGIAVVSGNTDGIVLKVPRDMMGPVVKDRFTGGEAQELIETWEQDTGFTMEAVPYRALYNQSVNSYIAVKEDGKAKWKGPVANPWRADDGWKIDTRGYLMKNPQMQIVANAVVDLILYDRPIEETIRASKDVRDFVTVVKVDGGATWRGDYLGKVVRYIWAKGGEEILRAKGHATTGNHGKVPKSDGCRPLMILPDSIPDDIDYDAYIAAARETLMDIGYTARPRPVKKLRIYKHSAILWWAIAV